jgi:hypothetical protein|tara:strand:+ start:592 stop:735 length:144 start_codon:yes stop_codon:yes gene_type:complete
MLEELFGLKGEVFTTGCTDWAYGLKDKDVAQVTSNVIDRFSQPPKKR